ncbi:hypothetical protein FACS1894172_18570 [Spirochaetia bacterium]|nr:hypothetical protein FACS1894164_02520 [Spirochaetia bacterium]GHU36067.1 hypothetical protein FACS1894172_18570 [Spirochaetia bacterium]
MKMDYREHERLKSIELIHNTDLFGRAKSGRIIKYKGRDYPKDEIILDGINNIYEPIRNDVLEYFVKNDISFWHTPRASEPRYKPTGHTLSSQVCCINHLFPIRHDEKTVLSIAKLFCPGIKEIFPIPTDKYLPGYIQFESVTDKDYLHELQTTRGSNCTSVDALIYGKHDNGKKYIIPIEWKYTEYYDNQDKSVEDRKGEVKGVEGKGKERLKRYSDLINNSLYLKDLTDYRNSVYFFEPFYQLMRQTLWAEQMIKHSDSETIKAADYIHIYIIPSMNVKLLEKIYKPSRKSMEDIWIDCLKHTEKYKIIDPINLLKTLDNKEYGGLIEYLNKRYWEK